MRDEDIEQLASMYAQRQGTNYPMAEVYKNMVLKQIKSAYSEGFKAAGYTYGDMKQLIDWCGSSEGFNLIESGETTDSLFKKYLKSQQPQT